LGLGLLGFGFQTLVFLLTPNFSHSTKKNSGTVTRSLPAILSSYGKFVDANLDHVCIVRIAALAHMITFTQESVAIFFFGAVHI
jgi:hypothetical protein